MRLICGCRSGTHVAGVKTFRGSRLRSDVGLLGLVPCGVTGWDWDFSRAAFGLGLGSLGGGAVEQNFENVSNWVGIFEKKKTERKETLKILWKDTLLLL